MKSIIIFVLGFCLILAGIICLNVSVINKI